jgi:hypothetical protein
MLACVAVTGEGLVDFRRGCTERVDSAKLEGDTLLGWEEFAVAWGTLRQPSSERAHHAQVAHIRRQHGIDTVVAGHMGEYVHHMLQGVLDVLA